VPQKNPTETRPLETERKDFSNSPLPRFSRVFMILYRARVVSLRHIALKREGSTPWLRQIRD
jgi:hypothetical protein